MTTDPQDVVSSDAQRMNALLITVAKTGDREAFRALFEYFAPRLKAFMARRGTAPGAAEDIVQETLTLIWRKAGQFDPTRASASTWVFAIARNLRIDHLRKANRPEPDMNDPALVPDPEPSAQDLVARNQQAGRLHAALAGLPVEQQAILQLAFFEEKAHAEIATELNLPLGTVKSRIRLAFKRIRDALGDIE